MPVHVERGGVPGRVAGKHHEMLGEADVVFLLAAGEGGMDMLAEGDARMTVLRAPV